MKISVVMPSYLGDYPNAAKYRSVKFKRAVDSFISQPYFDKELIIVSDGCTITEDLFYDYYNTYDHPRMHMEEYAIQWQYGFFHKMPKQSLFSGKIRNEGLQWVRGEIVCYLDTDDIFFGNHLGDIVTGFYQGHDWVYYNDFVALSGDLVQKRERGNMLAQGRIGTSSIAHRSKLDLQWSDGYEHDWRLIQSMMKTYPSCKSIRANGYLVCHIPGQCDF